VRGSDVPLGLSTAPGRKVFYVDHDSPMASDANDGTDPANPKLTIQSAVDSPWLVAGDVIVVGPATTMPAGAVKQYAAISTYNYTENVVVANTRPPFVHLMASGASRFQVVWGSANTALPTLTLQVAGWVVSGFKFDGPATSSSIRVTDLGNDITITPYTIIQDNFFWGHWVGLYGIEIWREPGMVMIIDNIFTEYHQGNSTAYAINQTNRAGGVLSQFIVSGNMFVDNDNHVSGRFGASWITGNAFFDQGSWLPALIKLDVRLGAHNIISGNFFDGAYTNLGGYWGSAAHPDLWAGNLATAGAGVGDNGFTAVPPA
jgi:hypothetical protein